MKKGAVRILLSVFLSVACLLLYAACRNSAGDSAADTEESSESISEIISGNEENGESASEEGGGESWWMGEIPVG